MYTIYARDRYWATVFEIGSAVWHADRRRLSHLVLDHARLWLPESSFVTKQCAQSAIQIVRSSCSCMHVARAALKLSMMLRRADQRLNRIKQSSPVDCTHNRRSVSALLGQQDGLEPTTLWGRAPSLPTSLQPCGHRSSSTTDGLIHIATVRLPVGDLHVTRDAGNIFADFVLIDCVALITSFVTFELWLTFDLWELCVSYAARGCPPAYKFCSLQAPNLLSSRIYDITRTFSVSSLIGQQVTLTSDLLTCQWVTCATGNPSCQTERRFRAHFPSRFRHRQGTGDDRCI